MADASGAAAGAPQITAIGLAPKTIHGMRYRRVGRSGLSVSEMGVGCFSFGEFVDTAGAEAVVHCALDLGINYFDTADSYGLGVSEEKLGAALVGRRSRAVIATKFSNRMDYGPNDIGTSRLHIVRACEASLRRLKTDYIDLYQVHWPDRRTPIEETMRALDDLVREGKVRYLGVANFFEWEICEAQWTAEKLNLNKFVSAQDHYNLLYRDIEKRMEPFCVRYGIGMNSYFPLAGGLLTGLYRRDEPAITGTRAAASASYAAWQSKRNWDVQEALQSFAEARRWSLPQMSLAWLLSRPAMSTIIAGADRPEHLMDNVKALDIRFTPEDLVEIDRLTLVDEDRSVAPVYRRLRPEKVHEFGPMQEARARALS
ncbi:aldo/keto reductase [Bradyrhizobium sp. NP1]|uniref:aldo/keto reductase n=1 Tax=Bradyrhizobium sp. NP1 TaxID=3049772 RepID=UPI0025A5421C|nr:aldo/keto reductase [Bradyrhizobium sp. NP1]WJR78226.1 aldo/keto reductase [Bradyrhizobium sp. NP1]